MLSKKATRSTPASRLSSGLDNPSNRHSKRAPKPPSKYRFNKKQERQACENEYRRRITKEVYITREIYERLNHKRKETICKAHKEKNKYAHEKKKRCAREKKKKQDRKKEKQLAHKQAQAEYKHNNKHNNTFSTNKIVFNVLSRKEINVKLRL